MTRKEFKEAYLDNAFFWVNENNYLELQDILQEFGIKCHIGGNNLIGWHDGFKNLVTFPADQFHNFEYYQKVDCWLPNTRYGEPKDIEKLISEYNKLAE